MREIEQSPLSCSDMTIENLGAVRHLGFDRKWIFTTVSRPPGTHRVLTHQIVAKSNLHKISGHRRSP